jgi:hypothetical protein
MVDVVDHMHVFEEIVSTQRVSVETLQLGCSGPLARTPFGLFHMFDLLFEVYGTVCN